MMRRRELLAGGLAAAMLLPMRASAGQPRTPSPRAAVIDTLCVGAGPDFPAAAVRTAGMHACVLDLDIYPRGPAEAEAALQGWAAAASGAAAAFRLIRNGADLDAAMRDGKFGIILASQDAAILGPSVFSVSDANLETLRRFHGLGLRVLQLTHNERNAVADGFRERNDGGLSLLGDAVIREMNALGMLVDLSHCSDLTTLSAIALSARPVAVTHAGCRALHPSRRNKTDGAIRALADKGGFFGVYMMSRWLTQNAHASVDNVIDHIEHVIRIGGIETVGFGSDQPPLGDPEPQAEKVAGLAAYQARNAGMPGADPLNGHVTSPDLDRPDRMAVLAAALSRRGHRAAAVDRILGGNFSRVFRESAG
jgi:membrane dipeptidase